MRRLRNWKPRFERLEQRSLLAGNVTALVRDGNLIITGDDAANTITVESTGEGVVQVRGFDGAGAATRVNGSPNALQTFNVTGDVRLQMRGASDLVRVTNLVVAGELVIDLGQGHDEAVLGRDELVGNARFGDTPTGPLYVHGSARVLGGANNDTVLQSDMHTLGSGVMNLGDGADRFTIRRLLGQTNVEYGGPLTLLPGAGYDGLAFVGMVVGGDMLIDDAGGLLESSHNGCDIHGKLMILSDEGSDNINLNLTYVDANIVINSASGNDSVFVSAIADRLNVDLGTGIDQLNIVAANLDFLYLQLGLGKDLLRIQSSTTGRINAFGDEGNDEFIITNTSATHASFYGDGGFDSFTEASDTPNQIENLRLFSMEKVEEL